MKSRCITLTMLLLALCLTLTLLVACDNSNQPTDTNADGTTPATEAVADTQADDETSADPQATTPTDTTTETQVATEPVTEAETLDPLTAAINAAEMSPDGDNFVVGDVNSDMDLAAQYYLLSSHPELYAGKSFTVYGKVMVASETKYIAIGEAGFVPIMVDTNEFGPMEGDEIVLQATFGAPQDAPTNYMFTAAEFELIHRPAGPNGGTLMFVKVNTSLNVRPAPTSSGNEPIGKFYRGDVVEVLEIVDGWAKIVYEGGTDNVAYVSASYLVN